MHQTVLIVAGGSGLRMNNNIPKQFLLIKDRPVLMHTINKFKIYSESIEVRLVLPHAQIPYWKELCNKYQFTVQHQIFHGGDNRFLSVKNGLSGIQNEGLIAIHDGVRPLVSKDTIQKCFETAQKTGTAIPVIDVVETLREQRLEMSYTVNRSNFKIVQTPQVFNNQVITKAYQQPYKESFTDDASVVESIGHPISMVEGNSENIKITRPIDLTIAEAIMNSAQD
jgi:2-C-methyl-D-erythritol 4-phosphate cytidylyltransferase